MITFGLRTAKDDQVRIGVQAVLCGRDTGTGGVYLTSVRLERRLQCPEQLRHDLLMTEACECLAGEVLVTGLGGSSRGR